MTHVGKVQPVLLRRCEWSIQIYQCLTSHFGGIFHWWEEWLTPMATIRHGCQGDVQNEAGMSNTRRIQERVVWRGTLHLTGSWRPAPSAERVPSWSDHRAGSSQGLQTSWLTRRARPREAWCRGYRWSSWRRCTAREPWNGANEGKRERTEDRCVFVSWVKQRRSQSAECHWQSSGSGGVRLTNSRVLICAVFLRSRVNTRICMHQWECLSIDRDWIFRGTRGILASTSRLWAELWHRGRGEISEECRESRSFESTLIQWLQRQGVWIETVRWDDCGWRMIRLNLLESSEFWSVYSDFNFFKLRVIQFKTYRVLNVIGVLKLMPRPPTMYMLGLSSHYKSNSIIWINNVLYINLIHHLRYVATHFETQ